jgi:hypothetical protein
VNIQMKIPYAAAVVVASVLSGAIADRLVIGRSIQVVHAQEATRLSIGNEIVSIGMAQDAAIAKFTGKYRISGLNDSSVVITTPEVQTKVPRTLGILSFENGRLTSATRFWADLWGGIDNDIEPLWNALHGALVQQLGGSRVNVKIECTSHSDPGSLEDRIELHFPKKDVEIGRIHFHKTDKNEFYVRDTVF